MNHSMADTHLKIIINYVTDTGEEHAIELTPEEYFDLDDSDDRSALDIDSTPKHQEVRGYIISGEPIRQARVRVSNVLGDNLWEVSESYWNQYGDEGTSVTVLEIRNGVTVGWNKFVSIRFSTGQERVLKFVAGDKFPLLDECVVIDKDTFIGIIYPERTCLFKKNN
jgi:hypothetical protein